MSSMKDSLSNRSPARDNLKRCQACSAEKNAGELSRCKGCESVWYCDKVSGAKELPGSWVISDSIFRHARPRVGTRKVIRPIARF